MTTTEAQRKILLCWDVDLCLINGGGYSHEIISVAFYRHTGYRPSSLPDMPGRTDRAISLDLLAIHHRPADELGPYLAHLRQTAHDLTDRLRTAGSVMPGAVESLEGLAGNERVLAQTVVTGNMRPNAEVKVSTLGADRHINFDIGGYGDTTVHRHELVRAARRRAEEVYGATIPASHVVVIGDTPRDVHAAHDADARAIGVATGHHSGDDLTAAGADHVLADLSDTAVVVDAVLGACT